MVFMGLFITIHVSISRIIPMFFSIVLESRGLFVMTGMHTFGYWKRLHDASVI